MVTHTRGLRKFGRPDVSIENIDESEVDKAVKVANQMIFYSAQGMLFNKKSKNYIHIKMKKKLLLLILNL